MGSSQSPEPISKAKILLVEGKDEVCLFTELLKVLNLANDIQIIEAKGKDRFANELINITLRSGFRQLVTSIGIIRDADNDPQGAFKSVCSALHRAELVEPSVPLVPKAGHPQVVVMIVPNADSCGMIENVCLDSVSDDPAMDCVEQFFQCLQEQDRILAENDIPKARVRAFLVSREWCELAFFEYLQRCMKSYEPVLPMSAASVVLKVHAFLASRYTPDLDLGTAAGKSEGEDRYWDFNHLAFEPSKTFLQMI
jgi:hypothetical protein